MSRDCLLCGAMICGCEEDSSGEALSTIFGLCESCSEGLADRCDERWEGRDGDYIGTVTHEANKQHFARAFAYLDSLQKERAS